MEYYITPQIRKYETIDDLLENSNKSRSLFDMEDYLSIDNLLQNDFVCIVGEPGIGKTKLIDEIKKLFSNETVFIRTASKLISIPKGIEYCLIDALDEVEGNAFHSTLQLIKQYKKDNLKTKVLFTCRKHYVASYKHIFASCKDLFYVELCRLKDKDVIEVIDKCPERIKTNVFKSPKLRELLTIPRYLKLLLEYKTSKDDISNIGELFEYFVSSSIQIAITNHKGITNTGNLKIIIQRVLEKIAFIMEISHKDQISKDELYTILDEVKGNMTQMLITNIDILFFENRILKDTNGILQFENTELQEYLAAKELCRQDNIESILYDVAVQKSLKHIYPNWYDVIPHISYKEDNIHTFINVIKLIISYESSLENEGFESLLKYVDSSVLLIQQKEEIFIMMIEHYLRTPTYVIWRSQILKLIQDCYTSGCNTILMAPFNKLNNIQLANINAILETIVAANKLDKNISKYWTDAANSFIKEENEDKKLASLNLYKALKGQEELIHLSKSYHSFSKNIKEKYCEVTGYEKFTCRDVVDCWLASCYKNNPYAINAILCIENPSTMVYAYNKIIEADKLKEFFSPKGSLLVCYELYLKKQFDIVWNNSIENKKLFSKIIASFINNHSYSSYSEFDAIIKQILLEKETGAIFIDSFENDWDLKNIFRRFEAKNIDVELISTLEILLHDSKIDDRYVDNILTTLINKIRNEKDKQTSISEYITRYADTFKLWDRTSSETEKMKLENPELMKAYLELSDSQISMQTKYETAFKLSIHLEFIKQQEPQPLIDVISCFFDNVDLDKMTLEKKNENSYTLSLALTKIPDFVKVISDLEFNDILLKYRVLLAKTLPILCCTSTNFDSNKIANNYRSIIGTLNKEEKEKLVTWWKSRKDDFMKISPESIFKCITDYGITELAYKLEEYINDYIKQQDLNHKLTASKALELISKGYLIWDIEKYRNVFNSSVEEGIDSIKMQCNAIMIEKYQAPEAIKWRFEYFRRNIVESSNDDTSHARFISQEESEIISSNPHMFRCFMNIMDNDSVTKQMFDLFDFALGLCNKSKTQEYSRYLLAQIYLFFVNTNDVNCISSLRKKVEKFSAANVSFLAYNIMNNAEKMYLEKEKTPIYKSIKLYNKCIEESHLEIRNDGDLKRYFTHILIEVQKEIQDQGIYSLVRQEALSEDFIQRELKNTIINKCCQLGLETIQIDREVTLQDNKRTDLLIRYGMCNPIMVELKLLHNNEIQNKTKRLEYKNKFFQYINATNACLSVFWVFDVHKKGSSRTKYEELKEEYKDIENTLVLLTDCKCSSGIETGISKNNKTPKKIKSRK